MASTEETSLWGSKLGDYHMKISIGDYKRPTPFKRSEWTKNKVIILPLPLELRDDTSVGYGNADLRNVGDIINGAYTGAVASAALGRSGDIISSVTGKVMDAAVGATSKKIGGSMGSLVNIVGGGISSAASDLFPADQVTSAIQQGMGMAPNPNPSVMFTGVQLRDFAYSWTIFPKNKTESDNLRRIISILKASALPENAMHNAASILKYPKMVQLNFYPWDAPYGGTEWGWGENSIIRHKKCFMGAVNVSYTPANVPAFFHDGNGPVATQLTISFREIEYFMSHDWGGNQAGEDKGFGDVFSAFGDFLGEQGKQATAALGETFDFIKLAEAKAPAENTTEAQP